MRKLQKRASVFPYTASFSSLSLTVLILIKFSIEGLLSLLTSVELRKEIELHENSGRIEFKLTIDGASTNEEKIS
jgi:hypothetical protein